MMKMSDCRGLRAPTLILFALLAGLILSNAAAQDLVIYDDSLDSSWVNWSWDTTVDFSASSPVFAGSASLSATHTAAWAGLYLHSNTNLDGYQYSAIRFRIHGGATGGQSLALALYDETLGSPGSTPIPAPAAGAWTLVEIPLSTFAPFNQISGFTWQDQSAGAQPAYYLDDIVLVASNATPTPTPTPAPGPALTVDAAAARQPISPHIYGINWGEAAWWDDIRVPLRRWGGNAVSRYNWQADATSRASDWYFESLPNANANPGALPFGSSSDQFVNETLAAGAAPLLTLPMIGWAATDRTPRCSFRVSVYGAQQDTDPWMPDCGNGVLTNGTRITGNDPTEANTPIGPAFVQAWVEHLMGQFGGANAGGVRFWNLDNEPMLWWETHRDVHPAGASYDELTSLTITYASALKAVDPAALTLGPVLWGWSAYFFSARDQELGGAQWWNTRPDRMAHGDVPFVEWFLGQMAAAETQRGFRLLDYLDLHYYPQSGVALQGAGNAATQALRLRSTRSLWDTAYVDESWIGEPVRLIPRMRDWVAAHYPGTKLAITEYNWGGLEHINGALAQAEVLGIFGREGLDLACLWGPPAPDDPGAFAFRMYLNYDGGGAAFGETGVLAASTDQSALAVYAAERASDGALTVMVINKTGVAQAAALQILNFPAGAAAEVWTYSAANLGAIVRQADAAVSGGAVNRQYANDSITLLVIPPAGGPTGIDSWMVH